MEILKWKLKAEQLEQERQWREEGMNWARETMWNAGRGEGEEGKGVLHSLYLEAGAVWWQISAQRMVISDGLFIQGFQTRPRTSLSLLGLKGAPTTQPNSSHSTLAPISSCLFPSTTQPDPTQSRQTQLRSSKKEIQAGQWHSGEVSACSPPCGQRNNGVSVNFSCEWW